MTRLGFVGVGKHASRLMGAFSKCGARVVAHDRKNDSGGILEPGFGKRVSWREQITSPDIDAVICCAPPEVTSEVARACRWAGKRCVATKPLLDCYPPPSSTLYVDLWRLYSPAWLAMKADLEGREIRSVRVDFYGDGPERSTHSGLLDYGPHALAFLFDLGLRPEFEWREPWKGQWTATGGNVTVKTGNGFVEPRMRVAIVDTDGRWYRWHETGQSHEYTASASGPPVELQCSRDLALRNLCRAFLAGEPSDTLRISCEATRMLLAAERGALQQLTP